MAISEIHKAEYATKKEKIVKATRTVRICAYLLAVVCAMSVSAYATTLTFEDLKANCDANINPPTIDCMIPNGYGGLNWDNFHAIDALLSTTSAGLQTDGYVKGLVSGAVDAYNGWGDPASISLSTPFTLHSVYLTGALNDGLTVMAQGYFQGNLLYTTTVTVSAYQPTFVSYEFNNVDQVVWSSWGGTDAGFGREGTQFALDDLSYDPVPEPYMAPALSFCLVAVYGVVRRRNNDLDRRTGKGCPRRADGLRGGHPPVSPACCVRRSRTA